MRLAGKVALVTGAGRGFGAGVSAAMAAEGCHLFATDIPESELLESLQSWQQRELPIEASMLDVSDPEAIWAKVDEVVAKTGRIDAFVHCAAIMPNQTFTESSRSLWEKELAINFGAFLHGSQACWPHMVSQGNGHLIGVASGASVRGFSREVIYCAGKHGLEGFSKALAFEAAPVGIAVNTIGPGKIMKPTGVRLADVGNRPEKERYQWADPEYLGRAFAWLVSQPTTRFNGLRFDAGPIADTIETEGWDFPFVPEKTTLYTDDMVARQEWWQKYMPA